MVHCMQSADKDLQESLAVTQKPRSAAVKFNMYRNLHRASHGFPFITASRLTLFRRSGRCDHMNSIKIEVTQ